MLQLSTMLRLNNDAWLVAAQVECTDLKQQHGPKIWNLACIFMN